MTRRVYTTPLQVRDGFRRWSRESAVESIKEWYAVHGETPSALDWSFDTDDHPSSRQVARLFGKWNAAIVAAGFVPRRLRGRYLNAIRERDAAIERLEQIERELRAVENGRDVWRRLYEEERRGS